MIGQLADQAGATSTRLDAIAKILSRHASVVNALDGLDHQVAAIAGQLSKLAVRSTASGEDYEPVPVPRWWHLADTEREAAALPACREHHPLCLYTLD
jgi:hypothetical protein